MSYTTRFTPFTSFTMRLEMVFRTSCGRGTQSAVMPSSEVDGADGAGVGVGALVAHHSHRHYGQQDRERLPDFSVEAGFLDFIDHDVIAFAQNLQALGCDFTKNSDRQARSGERLTLENFFRHAKVAADLADLVFE